MNDMGNIPKKPHTFRLFKDGENMWTGWDDLTEKIFQADHSYKCPTYVHRAPPCQGSCPSGHDIPGWLMIARQMDKPPAAGVTWQEYAFHRMMEANPFPSMMGRVCPAPCEDGCNRKEVDDFVGINAVACASAATSAPMSARRDTSRWGSESSGPFRRRFYGDRNIGGEQAQEFAVTWPDSSSGSAEERSVEPGGRRND